MTEHLQSQGQGCEARTLKSFRLPQKKPLAELVDSATPMYDLVTEEKKICIFF